MKGDRGKRKKKQRKQRARREVAMGKKRGREKNKGGVKRGVKKTEINLGVREAETEAASQSNIYFSLFRFLTARGSLKPVTQGTT